MLTFFPSRRFLLALISSPAFEKSCSDGTLVYQLVAGMQRNFRTVGMNFVCTPETNENSKMKMNSKIMKVDSQDFVVAYLAAFSHASRQEDP